MIADALGKVGGSGVISLEESQSAVIEVELTESLMVDNGWVKELRQGRGGAAAGCSA